jgi:site-specific DNA-methyltransferase (adenine-specific)
MAKPGPARIYATNAERQAAYRVRKHATLLNQHPIVYGEGYSLYQGDAVTLLPRIGPFDHCLTDPPYEQKAHVGTSRTRAGLEGRTPYAALDFAPITEAQRQFFGTLRCGWLVLFCQAEAVGLYEAVLGRKYREPLFWVKHDSAPNFQGDRPGMGYETLVSAWCRSGRGQWNRGSKRNVYVHSARHDPAYPHPTQKPVALLRELIRDFTQPHETIVDPFMGSASTGVACLLEGRRASSASRLTPGISPWPVTGWPPPPGKSRSSSARGARSRATGYQPRPAAPCADSSGPRGRPGKRAGRCGGRSATHATGGCSRK